MRVYKEERAAKKLRQNESSCKLKAQEGPSRPAVNGEMSRQSCSRRRGRRKTKMPAKRKSKQREGELKVEPCPSNFSIGQVV